MTWPKWHDKGLPNLREVAPHLWVGSACAAQLSPRENRRWALIIDLCGTLVDMVERGDPVISMHIEDGEEIDPHLLDKLIVTVHDARNGGHVLINCAAGLSRSASVAYAALRVLDDLPHGEALRRVRKVDRFPVPRTLESARRWADQLERTNFGRSLG